MIKLIASDMDGTLLRPGKTKPLPETINLIKELMKNGVNFVAASGRPFSSLYEIFGEIKDEISYIAENGSIIMDKGKVIDITSIDKELFHRIINHYEKVDFEVYGLVSTPNGPVLEEKNTEFGEILRNDYKFDVSYIDDFHNIEQPVIKIAFMTIDDTSKSLPYFREPFKSEIEVVTSGSGWVDFLAPGANKGIALEKLSNHLGIKQSETMAFGDQYNDIDMLSYAHVGYAMKNAAPGVSNYADEVTDCVDTVLQEVLNDNF